MDELLARLHEDVRISSLRNISTEDILYQVKRPSILLGLLGRNIPDTSENYLLIITHATFLARRERCIPSSIEFLSIGRGKCHLCNRDKRMFTLMFGCGICVDCTNSIIKNDEIDEKIAIIKCMIFGEITCIDSDVKYVIKSLLSLVY
jgi:hypothetical protein